MEKLEPKADRLQRWSEGLRPFNLVLVNFDTQLSTCATEVCVATQPVQKEKPVDPLNRYAWGIYTLALDILLKRGEFAPKSTKVEPTPVFP